MRVVTRYQTRDGREFPTEREANGHEDLLDAVDGAMIGLGPRPKLRNGEHCQHDRDVFVAARVRLLRIARTQHPTMAQHFAGDAHPHGFVGRLLDDIGGPLSKAWGRIMCIDDQGREWDQPFYAIEANRRVGR